MEVRITDSHHSPEPLSTHNAVINILPLVGVLPLGKVAKVMLVLTFPKFTTEELTYVTFESTYNFVAASVEAVGAPRFVNLLFERF